MITSNKQLKEYFKEGQNWSEQRFLSQRRFNFVLVSLVGFLSITTVALIITIILLLPLKTIVPFIIKVDQTGKTEIVEQLTTKPINYNDAIKKHFLKEFVQKFEGYNPILLKKTNYELSMMSFNGVYNLYHKRLNDPFFQAKTSNLSPGDGIIIDINTITLLDKNTALVRFKRQEIFTNKTITNKAIASIKFTFEANPKNKRFMASNPLGFIVTNYSVEEEIE